MGNQTSAGSVLITGASGFVGRHLVKFLCPDHIVVAFARRTQKEAGLDPHPNLIWMLVDITDPAQLRTAYQQADKDFHFEFIFHFAAYYDFGDQVEKAIYHSTNVQATQELLTLARNSRIRRFIFTSSLVASKFPAPGDLVHEKSQPDAEFPYAATKRQAEIMVQEHAAYFPCSIVRLAAVCSDWCEYEPLYHFLKIWLSERWDARILPGRGLMAIPYIHVCCVVALMDRIMTLSDELKDFDIFLASSDAPLALKDIFSEATRHYYGQERSPFFIPVSLARIGVILRNLIGKLTGNQPFEKLWMLDYTDRQFPTDCSYTRETLDWNPKDRHQLSRRLLHLIENLKARPDEWHRRNLDRLYRFTRSRPSLVLAEEMVKLHEELVDEIHDRIRTAENSQVLGYYQQMRSDDLKWYISVVYNNLLTSVRHGDRSVMITFAQDLARGKSQEGASLQALCKALTVIRDVITQRLHDNPILMEMKLLVHDYITLAIQLALDEIKDIREHVPR